jgi:Pyridoxal-phosphate dependent enzyme
MTPGTIFHELLSPGLPWASQLDALTPVEQGESGLWFKREDRFAPLGYGGINGSKLRQLVHLIESAPYTQRHGIITAASVHSPQVSMAALVGRHYQIPVTVVLGATRPSTARRHENVRIAQRAGARFAYTPVGFNPALQRACSELAGTEPYTNFYRLHYGITTAPDAPPHTVAAFHLVGAQQALNIPGNVRTLVIPFGSGNSACSVLTGIARYGAASLSRVVLVGIGPTRVDWLDRRLRMIEEATGLDIRGVFSWRTHDGPAAPRSSGPVLLEHYDLHSTGYVRYADRRPYRADGIEFHPTYEGKVRTWLDDVQPYWWKPKDASTLFWIVGSEPTEKAMERSL